MTLTSPQTVEQYEFLGILDKPKAGVTYKVRNLSSGELEVLRALPAAASGDAESRERFLREIRVHARLSHPNIAAFHDALELDGKLVMTSEYVDGVSLAERCRPCGLPLDEAARVIGAVLSGLEEAHALGIVHRGITAGHVTIARDGAVKLGGFGLAKPACDLNLTRTGAILGDPAYLSPEQVVGANALDCRSDLYSVGVLLYLALTGALPFGGVAEFDVMAAHVQQAPAPPSALNPAIPPAVDAVVLTALAKQPGQRFASAREFADALHAAVEGLPRPALVAPRAPAPLASARHGGAPLVFGILAAAVALAAVCFGVLHWL